MATQAGTGGRRNPVTLEVRLANAEAPDLTGI
jgi:hypothetical protein